MTISPDQLEIERAAALLRDGKLCAFPTETVYGLGADATNADAVLSIYETKGRPRFNPLIIHVADLDMAQNFAEFSPLALRLAALWPGPLSIVLPQKPGNGLADVATAGLSTVAIRIPDHPLARELLRTTGRPLAAPSANPSGKLSPTTAEQVRRGFAGAVPVLDGGPCKAGVESTIITIDGDRLVQLRAGAMAREDIEAAMGMKVELAEKGAKISAPGMLLSHYAPEAHIRLNTAPQKGEAYLAFGPAAEEKFDGPTRNLSPTGDLREAARNLFAMLHELDAAGVPTIAVAPVPETGLGEAINDRLARAAAPRG
ncbi:MAG: threonylcarbamoyl-AMP synthase [Devosia sp.]|jgi:L-threonylcarbamoyladenylate synthase|uniref:L-threonylcarbamoyladenylate synthase n=1 Tax=unclassified Devosia TaxID=196773 RepID=UPI0019F4ECF0|nr:MULTISPECIES: L-threonylcarbamoyladenylate synthase [unclassified Devosia]MBF0680981.1 threonylcarbamoyl-AMP synthase [Devosia sp.]WEJ32643.1 L-threonylcarbamoyladenylate synthase [Devosia sp. SD17-2]